MGHGEVMGSASLGARLLDGIFLEGRGARREHRALRRGIEMCHAIQAKEVTLRDQGALHTPSLTMVSVAGVEAMPTGYLMYWSSTFWISACAQLSASRGDLVPLIASAVNCPWHDRHPLGAQRQLHVHLPLRGFAQVLSALRDGLRDWHGLEGIGDAQLVLLGQNELHKAHRRLWILGTGRDDIRGATLVGRILAA